MFALLTWASLALGLAPLPAEQTANRGQAAGPEVSVKRDEILRANVYTAIEGDCRIEWTVFHGEPNRGVARHRSDCSRPLGQQAPLIGRVLRKALEFEGAGWEFRTLSWGRVFGDGANDVTMAIRLAVAARRSPGWNAATGRPRSGDINGWIRSLGRDSDVATELRQVFEGAGLKLEIASVEKVLTGRAGGLVFSETLSRQGVRANDRVPFDCQLWFSVARLHRTGP